MTKKIIGHNLTLALGLIKEKYLTELPEEMAMKEIREMRLDKPGFGFATTRKARWKPFDLYADGEHPVPKERLEAEKDLQIGKQVLNVETILVGNNQIRPKFVIPLSLVLVLDF
jgi:hypothetical protein